MEPVVEGSRRRVNKVELAEAAAVLRRLLDAVEAGELEVDRSGAGLGPREVALLRRLEGATATLEGLADSR